MSIQVDKQEVLRVATTILEMNEMVNKFLVDGGNQIRTESGFVAGSQTQVSLDQIADGLEEIRVKSKKDLDAVRDKVVMVAESYGITAEQLQATANKKKSEIEASAGPGFGR